MAVIAQDGYFPAILAKRSGHIPSTAIICMSGFAFLLILAGSLQVILEFGSITFLLVSLLMAYANYTIRQQTNSSLLITLCSIAGLLLGTGLIIYYEFKHQPQQLIFIMGIYTILTLGAWFYSIKNHSNGNQSSKL